LFAFFFASMLTVSAKIGGHMTPAIKTEDTFKEVCIMLVVAFVLFFLGVLFRITSLQAALFLFGAPRAAISYIETHPFEADAYIKSTLPLLWPRASFLALLFVALGLIVFDISFRRSKQNTSSYGREAALVSYLMTFGYFVIVHASYNFLVSVYSSFFLLLAIPYKKYVAPFVLRPEQKAETGTSVPMPTPATPTANPNEFIIIGKPQNKP
jgi:hypothetical protein